MKLADQVRKHCKDKYIDPAREKKNYSVTICAGDIHKELKFSNRLPLVCSAIGTANFEASLNLKRISIDGPLNGSRTYFTFLFREALDE